jgi:hypothetical protein
VIKVIGGVVVMEGSEVIITVVVKVSESSTVGSIKVVIGVKKVGGSEIMTAVTV